MFCCYFCILSLSSRKNQVVHDFESDLQYFLSTGVYTSGTMRIPTLWIFIPNIAFASSLKNWYGPSDRREGCHSGWINGHSTTQNTLSFRQTYSVVNNWHISAPRALQLIFNSLFLVLRFTRAKPNFVWVIPGSVLFKLAFFYKLIFYNNHKRYFLIEMNIFYFVNRWPKNNQSSRSEKIISMI